MIEPVPSNDIRITIVGEPTDSGLGSKVNEKREPVDVELATVTPENWQIYFQDKKLTHDKKLALEKGNLYIKAAVDPSSGATAGHVEVYRNHDNALSVYVEENYHRRGVATTLIRQAQSDHDRLHLLNWAGQAGSLLYQKMGFVPEGIKDHFVWRKT